MVTDTKNKYTTITVHKDVVEGLKAKAKGRPVAKYLREITEGVIDIPSPVNTVKDVKLALTRIENRLDSMDKALKDVIKLTIQHERDISQQNNGIKSLVDKVAGVNNRLLKLSSSQEDTILGGIEQDKRIGKVEDTLEGLLRYLKGQEDG